MVTSALRELRVDPKEKRIKWARAVVKESLWVCEGRAQTCKRRRRRRRLEALL